MIKNNNRSFPIKPGQRSMQKRTEQNVIGVNQQMPSSVTRQEKSSDPKEINANGLFLCNKTLGSTQWQQCCLINK